MDQIKIGRLIRRLRTDMGLTQKQLSERLHVSDKAVSKWECGGSAPDLEKLVAISDLFDISLDELVHGKTPEPEPVPAAQMQTAGAAIYSDIKENIVTDENKKRAKKGVKIAAIIAGVILLVDFLSFAIYIAVNGFPK